MADEKEGKTISFTLEKLVRFKNAYNRAKAAKGLTDKDTFVFDGEVFVVDYAKLAIQYLEMQLKR